MWWKFALYTLGSLYLGCVVVAYYREIKVFLMEPVPKTAQRRKIRRR